MAESIESRVHAQNIYFSQGRTLPVSARLETLQTLKNALLSQEDALNRALKADLGKNASESYLCETGMALSEINHMIRHVKSYARPKSVRTPLAQFPAHSFRVPTPYGTVLVMSPWNYPLLLSLDPTVEALAAGNTVILKPSAYAPRTSEALVELFKCLPEELVSVVTGGREENAQLLDCKFDSIFFTGSASVGHLVMEKAARYLTPVTLELGGKSPCIVEKSANIKLAARRIAFGKFLNCGQTCVAPDYILCEKSVHDSLLAALKEETVKLYGNNPLANPDYGKIVNRKHFDRISGLIDPKKVVFGGKCDASTLRIEPTILDSAEWSDTVMGEEIFGPVLPILTYDSLPDVLQKIDARPKPLALYIFSSDKKQIRHVLQTARFGGGCVNDTIIHLATDRMPFGGVGESGMGGYHGRAGFETFSHFKSVVDKKTWLDLPMRYPPYTRLKDRLIRMFLK